MAPLIYDFADFTLDSDEQVLTRGGHPIPLQAKAFAVLQTLVEEAGRTVTREEFEARVWTGVRVTPDSLHRCIALVRTALGEREGEVALIRTVRGRGYRMGVPVHRRSAPGERGKPEESAIPARPAPIRRRRWLVLAAVAGAVGLLAWLGRPATPFTPPVGLHAMAVPDDLERVAVLPFRDLSPGADDHHLARGISDEVVHRLATIPALAVISSTSSYRYRDAAPEVAARELHAGILVTGSLRREEDQLRVRVEVAETKGGTQLWSGSFDGHTTSVFALQEQIGRAVARVVAVDLPTPAPTAERERNALAYEISLRGRAAAFERERAHQERAVEFYRRALEIDPEDADTYTALAQAERELSYVPGAGAGRHLDNATLAIERALRLAPDDARALTADGAIRMKRREWRRAEQSLRRALALERSAAPHLLLGHLFIMTDRLEAARDQLERARRLDPMSPILERTAGRLHLYLGEYDEAIARLRRALELSPHDPDAPRLLAESLYRNGDEQRAGEVLIRIAPRWLRVAFRIDHRIEGPTQSLRHLLAFDIWRTGRACREDPQGTALMWAFLGEPDEMLACLEVTEPQELAYSWVEPAMRPYREDPRFRKIMRKGGYGPVIDGEFAPSAAQNSIRPPTVRLRSP